MATGVIAKPTFNTYKLLLALRAERWHLIAGIVVHPCLDGAMRPPQYPTHEQIALRRQRADIAPAHRLKLDAARKLSSDGVELLESARSN